MPTDKNAGPDCGAYAQDEATRIQNKQGSHHLFPRDDEPALDDTDRNGDKIIKPGRIDHR